MGEKETFLEVNYERISQFLEVVKCYTEKIELELEQSILDKKLKNLPTIKEEVYHE